MEMKTVVNSLVFSTLLIFLTACDDSSGVFEEIVNDDAPVNTGTSGGTADSENTDTVTGTDDSGNTDTGSGTDDAGNTDTVISTDDIGNTDTVIGTDDSGNTEVTDGTDDILVTQVSAPVVPIELQAEGSNIGLSSELPEFLTSDCGTLSVSDAMPSNNRSAPTTMTVGQLVSGNVDPATATNAEHAWQIAVEPGFYHLVLDTERVDKQISSLGMRLTDLDSFGTNDGVLLIDGRETDNRARFHAYFEVKETRTMNILIKPNWDGEEYTFGVFRNGSAVPSPLFKNCPAIKSIFIDTDESFILPESNGPADDRWFLMDLVVGEYLRFTNAVRTDGEADNNQFGVYYVDQFGQSKRFMGFGVGLERTEAGPVWLRVQNFGGELSVEFALFLFGF